MQCSECHKDVNSNKRGSGSLVKAQATARVDVSTANTCASFGCECLDMCLADPDLECSSTRRRVNAWICARRASDRDLESFNVNAWICTRQSTDGDLESFNMNAWMFAQSTTDCDLETKK